jgi:signal transduction histidine kinase
MKFNSIRFEISVLHTAVLGFILIIFSFILYFISNTFFQQIDQQLKVKAEAVNLTIKSYLNVLGEEDPNNLMKAVRKTLGMRYEGVFSGKIKKISDDWFKEAQTLDFNRDYIHFFSKDGKQEISSPNLEESLRSLFMEDVYFATTEGKMSLKTLNYKHENIRLITYPLSVKPTGEYFIQIGVSQNPIMQQFRNWVYSVIASFPLILILTNFVGRKQAARILKPVHEITDMVNKITHQDLSARITAKHFDSDMESLIESFNHMIARLENSFQHIEDFSHHVAHELKTPLTIIKGEADLLLRKDRSKHEYQQALRIILEESERVLKTIEDLLLLSKLDYQPDVFKFEVFDFMEFFSEICEQCRMLAAKKAVAITMRKQDVNPDLMIRGDRLHLRRLFFNIIDNAIKFTPERSNIQIRISNPSNKIIVTVSDSGPGIAPEDLKKIFEKFFSVGSVGYGLGLNIAWTIAKLHKGEILAESRVGQGTTFTIILPAL